jgi:hypothetical protein
MTQCRGEMMVDRLRGILGRVVDGVSPGQGYRDFVSYFGIPVSEFSLIHRDELIDEVSDVGKKDEEETDWIHSPLLFIWCTQPST